MLFPNRHLIHIHALLEPPLPLTDGDVIPAHLPLLHAAVWRERPVLEAVAAPPLAGGVAELVPELDSDLGVSATLSSLVSALEGEGGDPPCCRRRRTAPCAAGSRPRGPTSRPGTPRSRRVR